MFDLSDRAKFRVRGADRVRYLNGQITNDMGKASATQAIRAAVLNAKGHMNADVFIHCGDDSFLLDSDSALRLGLAGRLERYVIADDVEIDDVTEEFALLHFVDVPAGELDPGTVAAQRFGCVGYDLWLPPSRRAPLIQQFGARFRVCDSNCAELLRIERGIPRWGNELSEEIIPVEAGLESVAIDYSKGCYIGQEVISRIKMSGQTNKRLRGLISISGAPLRSGTRLSDGEQGTREVGWITSAARSPRLEKEIALGFVKRGFNAPGTRLLTGGDGGEGVPVEVVELPFA